MTTEELYNHFDQNWVTVGRELKVGSTSIQNWRKWGFIPIRTQMLIEKRTSGLFKARLEDARI